MMGLRCIPSGSIIYWKMIIEVRIQDNLGADLDPKFKIVYSRKLG